MILLTDCPTKIDPWFESEHVWEESVARDLPETIRQLIKLFGERSLAYSTYEGFGLIGRWDCLVVFENAPESQFDVLTKAAREGLTLPNHVACLALAGQKFHGNRNRSWQALEGNIHLSTFHRFDVASEKLGHGATMVPSLAVVDTIRKTCPDLQSFGIKWVNDVLINRRKVSGAITSTQRKDGRIQSVCWGIGMNVLANPQISPADANLPPTSLAESQKDNPPAFGEVLCTLLASLSDRCGQLVGGGSDTIFPDYQANLIGIGERVSIWPEDATNFENDSPLARGILKAVNPDLSLTLEGHAKPLHRGRLVLDRK